MIFPMPDRSGGVEQLLSDGFTRVGAWPAETQSLHRVQWIKYRPGVYAFIVEGSVMYVGKAGCLHRRLRNYGRRCFQPGARKLRACHSGILAAIGDGHTVEVYALVVLDNASDLHGTEARYIRKLRPSWNRTHALEMNDGPEA